MLIHPDSLSETVDALNEALASGQSISARDRTAVARWIASRQGLPGAYANTFAGFESERKNGIRLFTGERVNSASARHILGEECCRAIRKLDVKDKSIEHALACATEGLQQSLSRWAADPRHANIGTFCCGKCTVGLWRHLIAGGLDRQEERLTRGVQHLRLKRDGAEGWRTFPFWYTILALTEIDHPKATTEIRYARAVLERTAGRAPATRFARRRQAIAERALARS